MDTYQDALDHFGEKAQAQQAMEECAELIVALNKAFNRGLDPYLVCVAEEIADVEIMLEQIKRIPEINRHYRIQKRRKFLELRKIIGSDA